MSSGVIGLAEEIKKVVDQRIESESRAKRGVMSNGLFYSGAGSYVCQQAMEVNPGLKTWAVRSKGGTAVVIGQ